jgi:hypothetical protein
MPQPDVVAIKADGGHIAALWRTIFQHPGLFELSPIAGEPTGDDDGVSERVIEAFDELTPVDIQAIGQNQDASQRGLFELLSDGASRGVGTLRGWDGCFGCAKGCLLKLYGGDDQAIIRDLVPMNFSGGRTTHHVTPGAGLQ